VPGMSPAVPQRLDVAVPATAVLGEGPTWDAATGTLLWVDILASEVHRFDPTAGGRDTVLARTPQHVGAAKPRAAGGVVVNLRDGIGRYAADGAFDWLATWAREGVRGNDAAVDADGRLWAGTMRYDEAPGGGRLYRVDADGGVVTVLPEVSISNGIGWSPDGQLLYYVDTPSQRVDVFDVDRDTGLVARRRGFVDLARVAGSPDGLTVDADGCVWVALWDGGAVHRYTPAGTLDRVVEVPASRTTACVFGGPGLGDLYITTATVGLDAARLAAEPLAGSLFVLPAAGAGQPGHAFKG
jgi:sugar lactone lactonase YvrE